MREDRKMSDWNEMINNSGHCEQKGTFKLSLLILILFIKLGGDIHVSMPYILKCIFMP